MEAPFAINPLSHLLRSGSLSHPAFLKYHDKYLTACLMEYLYFPRIAYLDESEMRQYIKLTKVLLQYFNKDELSLKNNKEATELLMKRKRIIHKAQDKYRVFEDIISELVKQNKAEYCFNCG